MTSPQLSRTKIIILLSIIFGIAILPVAGAAATVSAWATPCCPNIGISPVYDYYGNQIWPPEGQSFDPYYSFPVYCSCPFLDDALKRPWSQYFPLIIVNNPTSTVSSSSSCSTCSAAPQGSSEQSFTYMSETVNVPDKSDLIASKSKSGSYNPSYSKKVLVL
jgi:hypothetical protein